MDRVIGHDFGSPVAGYCTLIRPDIFRFVVTMSGPFSGPPGLLDGEHRGSGAAGRPRLPARRPPSQERGPGSDHPHPLEAWPATESRKQPTYYVMELDEGMPATVAHEMPSAKEIDNCSWLSGAEMVGYAGE